MNVCWKEIHIQKSEAKTFEHRQHADGQTKKPSPGITAPNGIDLSGAGSMRGQPIEKSQGQKTWVNFQILVPNLSFCAFICWANLRTVSKFQILGWLFYFVIFYLIVLSIWISEQTGLLSSPAHVYQPSQLFVSTHTKCHSSTSKQTWLITGSVCHRMGFPIFQWPLKPWEKSRKTTKMCGTSLLKQQAQWRNWTTFLCKMWRLPSGKLT